MKHRTNGSAMPRTHQRTLINRLHWDCARIPHDPTWETNQCGHICPRRRWCFVCMCVVCVCAEHLGPAFVQTCTRTPQQSLCQHRYKPHRSRRNHRQATPNEVVAEEPPESHTPLSQQVVAGYARQPIPRGASNNPLKPNNEQKPPPPRSEQKPTHPRSEQTPLTRRTR